jgi:hypothetical protein
VRVCSAEGAVVALQLNEFLRGMLRVAPPASHTGPTTGVTGNDPSGPVPVWDTGAASLPQVDANNISPLPRWDVYTLAGLAAILRDLVERERRGGRGPSWWDFFRMPLPRPNPSFGSEMDWLFRSNLLHYYRAVRDDIERRQVSVDTTRVALFLLYRRDIRGISGGIQDPEAPITIEQLQIPPNALLPTLGAMIPVPDRPSRPALHCRVEFGAPGEQPNDDSSSVIVPIPPTFDLNPPRAPSPLGPLANLTPRTKLALAAGAGLLLGIAVAWPAKPKNGNGAPRELPSGTRRSGVPVKEHVRKKRRAQKLPKPAPVAPVPARKPTSRPAAVKLPSRGKSGEDGAYWARIAANAE